LVPAAFADDFICIGEYAENARGTQNRSSSQKPSLPFAEQGILLVTGGLLWFETLTDWTYAKVTSPVYLFAVAFGHKKARSFFRLHKGSGVKQKRGCDDQKRPQPCHQHTYSGVTWPVYIWAPALGLFELWYFGGRKLGVLIPGIRRPDLFFGCIKAAA
jgi:hypothetical protein